MNRLDTLNPLAVSDFVMLARLEHDISGHQAEVCEELIRCMLETSPTVTMKVLP